MTRTKTHKALIYIDVRWFFNSRSLPSEKHCINKTHVFSFMKLYGNIYEKHVAMYAI